jgi:putative SOS response-associated peptidase YedK
MCGRFTLSTKAEALEERFHATLAEGVYAPNYNAVPLQALLTILNDNPEVIVPTAWGFVPAWAEGRSDVKPLINARGETVASKPFFRTAFKSSRCLVLSDGFYEWRRAKSGKVPYRIALKTKEPFAFAGIWSRLHDAEGAMQTTFALIITEANALVAHMHHRMPVILREEDEEAWLNPQLPLEAAQNMLAPFPAERLTAYQVSARVNAASHNTPELIKPV